MKREETKEQEQSSEEKEKEKGEMIRSSKNRKELIFVSFTFEKKLGLRALDGEIAVLGADLESMTCIRNRSEIEIILMIINRSELSRSVSLTFVSYGFH
jgi:hypothetical protein